MLRRELVEYLNRQGSAAKKELFELLRKRRRGTILFAGAGSSAWAGYKDWEGLLKEINDRCLGGCCPRRDGEELDKWAGRLLESVESRDGNLNKYHALVEELFKPKTGLVGESSHNVHRLLARMQFAGYVTTNYDWVLEDALETENWLLDPVRRERVEAVDMTASRDSTLDFIRSLTDVAPRSKVLHIHGIYSNPPQVILTRKQLEEAYLPVKQKDEARETDSFHAKVLWSLLTHYRIVFVGFNAADPLFSTVLAKFMGDFGQTRQHHFSIVPLRLDAKDDEALSEHHQLLKLGVAPIYYLSDKGDYTNFLVFVHEMSRLPNAGPYHTEPDKVSALLQRTIEEA